MTIATMRGAVAILEAQEVECSLEYPGLIHVQRGGWIYVFGDANEDFGGDAYANWEAYEQGKAPDPVPTPLMSDCADPAAVAQAILDAVAAHQEKQEPRYLVINETDGVPAHPDPMTREQCDVFMEAFRQRFAAQGYYASVEGRIPVSELRLKR